MRLGWALVIGIACGTLIGPVAASADNQPAIVVPVRPGVPIIINGYDASWAVVEGDWGLYRPGAVPVTVIYPQPWWVPPRPSYVHRWRPRRVSHSRKTAASCACRRAAVAARAAYVPPAARHYFPSSRAKPVLGRFEINSRKPAAPADTFFRSWSTESADIPASSEPPSPIVVEPSVVEKRMPRRRRAPDR